MVSREKWEARVEARAWVFRLLQVLEGTTTKTKATSWTTTTTSKETRASCTGVIKRPKVQHQQQKSRWSCWCYKGRCAVLYIGQQQQQIRWENHLKN